MGSQQFYPDEGPVHTEHVKAFAIEQHPVTNAQFSDFVADISYLTVAERPLEPALFPDLAPEELEPGGLIFVLTAGPVDLSDCRLSRRKGVCEVDGSTPAERGRVGVRRSRR